MLPRDQGTKYQRAIVCMVTAITLLGLTACKKQSAPSPVPTSSQAATYDDVVVGGLSALGIVRPAQDLQLSFGAAAPVAAVHAQLGREVAAGELLAELDTAALELERERAQQDLLIAKAHLAGPAVGTASGAGQSRQRGQVSRARSSANPGSIGGRQRESGRT